MFVVEQKGLVGLPYSPASPGLPYSSPCSVPFVVELVVGVVIPGRDLPPWDLSNLLAGRAPSLTGGCSVLRQSRLRGYHPGAVLGSSPTPGRASVKCPRG